ncbi:hypothetical protein RB195_017213 [Necator americanus]|uniref:EF-hand domain-containing protein n=1 Tax=Necator americanus TaxID=51031 RepID=A0ABR1C6C3_NECAM
MWSVVRLRSQRSIRRMKKTQSERQRNLERQFGDRAPTSNKFLKSLYWALRGCQYWLCFYDDEAEIDVEDLLSNPFNTQPPSLGRLQQLTGFNKDWLMFMYRNFKQRCSNGRMMSSQWRAIFRMLFPHAADHQFADRLYKAITEIRGHPHITFEDLIICLWEMTEGAQCSEYSQSKHPDISIKAAFVFAMMSPDPKGLVDAAAFHDYVRSVFTLCGSNREMDASSALGLPSASMNRRMTIPEIQNLTPYIKRFATERFRSLDTDHDGFITVSDVEEELKNGRNFVLMSRRDIEEASKKSEANSCS